MERSSRKWQHIQHALTAFEESANDFDEMNFLPNSLPDIASANVDLHTTLLDWTLDSPILINAMTGGSHETQIVNQKLSIIANVMGLSMAVGSQMAALRDPQYAESYKIVHKEHPRGLLFANLGAEATVEQAKRAVDMIDAQALQIHLNVMQELLMPEGDRDFSGYLQNIERIVAALEVPVIVKEVGFGMTRYTYRKLHEVGVAMIDVGGAGGTNFARIENKRSEHPFYMFDNWGLSTVQSMLEMKSWKAQLQAECTPTFIASGGVRHGLDVCKAMALGASAVGMAGVFLKWVQTMSMDDCMKAIEQLHQQIKITMMALGCIQLSQLANRPFTLGTNLYHWALQRGVHVTS